MNKFTKNLHLILLLSVIGIGAASIITNSEINNQKMKNVVLGDQFIEKDVIGFNKTTMELIFDNGSIEITTCGKVFLLEDLKLPREKEQQAIDVALNDPDVKKILDGKKYSVTKVQKVAITTVDRTYLSEDIVVVEIEVGNLLYFVNVDMLKKSVQGNVVPIQKVEMVKNVS